MVFKKAIVFNLKNNKFINSKSLALKFEILIDFENFMPLKYLEKYSPRKIKKTEDV